MGDPASTSLNRDSHLLQIRALLDAMTTEKKTWVITGAGRGMGVDIASELSSSLALDDAETAAAAS